MVREVIFDDWYITHYRCVFVFQVPCVSGFGRCAVFQGAYGGIMSCLAMYLSAAIVVVSARARRAQWLEGPIDCMSAVSSRPRKSCDQTSP